MQKKRNLFLVVLMLGILVWFGKAQTVQAETTAIEPIHVTYVNPLYEDVLDVQDLVDPSVMPLDDVEYCTTTEAAGDILREQMKARNQTITVGLQSDGMREQDLHDIFEYAVEHTGVPTEGDYLLFQCGGWQCIGGGYTRGGVYYLTLTYTVTYYTTAAMEKQVTSTANKLLTELNISNASEYEKIKAVYDWVCQNVTYDYEGLANGNDLTIYTAYAALINKKAVCQGYSVLLYRLFLEMGLDSRIIVGNDETHAWNIVKIGIRYYNVDATWDSVCEQVGLPYEYFLRSMETFEDHVRRDEFLTDAYMKLYPMSEDDYDASDNNHPVPEKPYRIVNVVSGPHVYWQAVTGAEKYGVWRSETGKDGTYKWLGNPTVPHFTDVTVESGKTYYYRITTVVNGEHSEKSEAIGITYVATPDLTQRLNCAAGISVSWEKIEGATGYAIYRKTGEEEWTRITTITGNETFTWIDTSVKNNNGTVYKYTIRALAGSNNNTLSGCRGAGRTMVRLSSQVLTSAAKTAANSIKCAWTTSSRVTGYEVRFMVDDTVYQTYTIGNYKTGVKTFTGLPAGKTYTIQVRTYKKVDGVGSFYSDWSTAKRVSI